METRLIIWVIGILVAAVIALYFDNRHGEPGKTDTRMRPREGDVDKERQIRLNKWTANGMYGWMMVGKEFRPIRIIGTKNGKIVVKVQHNYEKDEDLEWTVSPEKIYVTEYAPGDYARLWNEHVWRLEHAEDDQRAKEWHDQHFDERP